MSGLLRSMLTYNRLAIGFVALCAVSLYVLALAGRTSVAYAPNPPISTLSGTVTKVAPLRKTASVLLISSAHKLADLFNRIGYRLDDVRRHGAVPRIYLTHLPSDLTEMRPAADRKGVFIRAMLPLILRSNERILIARARIESLDALVAAGVRLNAADTAWLDSLARRYRAPAAVPAVLLRHVDIVPPSLALAQGAEESGWGTSRFAREGNALYGQRVYRGSSGMVPKGRGIGDVHRVRTFGRLLDGVESYMRNLNSHPAYAGFRAGRAAMRAESRQFEGHKLAGALIGYSERGTAYVNSLQEIIRANLLSIFDRARFDGYEAGLGAGPDA